MEVRIRTEGVLGEGEGGGAKKVLQRLWHVGRCSMLGGVANQEGVTNRRSGRSGGMW